MSSFNNKIILALVIFASWSFSSTLLAYSRKDITTYGPSVSGAGYGDAATSYCQDLTSHYYNPALLSDFTNTSLTASHFMLFDNTSYDFFAAGHQTNYGFLGLSAARLSSGDIELRQTIDAAPSVSRSNQYIFTAIYASRIEPLGIGAGLNVKYFYSELAGYTASGIGIDAGLNKNVEGPLIMDKSSLVLVGLNFRNIMPPAMRFLAETDNYPSVVNFGTAIRIPTLMRCDADKQAYYSDKLTSSLDIEYNADFDGISLRPGFEYSIMDRYFIRTGYRDNLTFGLGYRIGSFQFDYAMDPKPYTNMHRVSIIFNMDGPKSTVKKKSENSPAQNWFIKSCKQDLIEARKQSAQRNRMIRNLFSSAKRDYVRKRFLKANEKLTDIMLKYPDFEKARIHYEKIESEMKEMSLNADISNLEELSYSKGYIGYRCGKMQDALNEWEKVLQINPKRKELDEYILKAKEYIKDAERQVKEKEFENNVSAIFIDAVYDYEKKSWVSCIKKMEKVQNICKDGQFSKAYEWSNKAQSYIINAVKELSISFSSKEDLKKKPSGDTDVIGAEKKYREGLILYAQGKSFEAIRSWEVAVRLNPSHEKAWKALGKVKDELDTNKYK